MVLISVSVMKYVCSLLSRGQAITHHFVQDGYSPLYVASQEGHTDVVDVLVKAGADVNDTSTTVSMGSYYTIQELQYILMGVKMKIYTAALGH